ncbi:MAG: c-type cytochrome, partial [Thiotrichales bacterium]|nr:c-type cytochrome [Thiotrichales bacterium]
GLTACNDKTANTSPKADTKADTAAAPTKSMEDIITDVYGGYGKGDAAHRYLDNELHGKEFGTFAERHTKDGAHPYSSEVDDKIDGGNRGKAECKVPKAFNTVWENAQRNLNADQPIYGYGTPVNESTMKKWDINVYNDGEGLPPKGVGMTVAEGEKVYLTYCAMCHGEFAEGAKGYLPLVGGSPDLSSQDPKEPNKFRTLGNYWPFITSLHDYLKRAMPFFAPVNDAIGDAGYLGISGFLAYSEGLTYDGGKKLDENTFIDGDMLLKINKDMPNADKFFCDDRPAVHVTRCMSNCDDSLVGDGKGNIHNFTSAVTGPDGKPQYNVVQRPDGEDVAAGVGKSDQ